MIHSTAIVSDKSQIGKGVDVGPFTLIHDNVSIGDNTTIEGYCEIGHPTELAGGLPLIIGNNSFIRSKSIFYQGSTFGNDLVTGHRVTVRERTNAGKNLHVGTLCDLQGDCTIGDYVRIHSNVHVGKESKIGNFVWIYPYVVLTNDPHPPSNVVMGVTIHDFAVIAVMSVLLPGIVIGDHSLVAAHSMVKKDVLPFDVVAGNPARKICSTSQLKLKDGSEAQAYPWSKHFHRGYPREIVDEWMNEYPKEHSMMPQFEKKTTSV